MATGEIGEMWQIIGQDKVLNSLKQSLANERLSHAYLLVGPAHTGKMTLAINLAQALNCPSEDKPCGQCSSCQRILSGNHPDAVNISRTNGSESADQTQHKNITIDQIRQMQQSVILKPYEGGHRVIIIDGAEFMSEEAANALLKTLEEPPQNTIFILLATEEASLLSTILSRCQKVDFKPMPIEAVKQVLIDNWQLNHQKADILSRLSHGAIGWAISAIDDETIIEQRSLNLERLVSLTESDITERFEFANEMATLFGKNRVLVRNRLELWLSWWRDLLLTKYDCERFATNIDKKEMLDEHSKSYSPDSIHVMIKSIQETMRQLEQNANPRLALEVLMLNTNTEREKNYA